MNNNFRKRCRFLLLTTYGFEQWHYTNKKVFCFLLSEKNQNLFYSIKEYILSLGDDISENQLKLYVAFKKAKYLDKNGNIVEPDSPNAYKFEAFLFDAFGEVDDMAILRVKREEEFAPVKNAEGADSPETARELYNNLYNK